MRIRKLTALLGAVSIFVGCLLLYRLTDHTFYQDDKTKLFPNNNWIHTKDKTDNTEERRHNKLISTNQLQQHKNKTRVLECRTPSRDSHSDIQMLEVYNELKFDNVDGGVWKQGWNVESKPSRWNLEHKLRVFVVPHSHNDPGWLKTFEDYYSSQTRNILNSMLKKMSADSKMKFIWAEISYFVLWWNEISEEDQQKVKLLIENGQLEMVTGGWVMTDEANAHYYSILTQLTEGHQWLKTNVNARSLSSWCIDPFGKSSAMPYLLKKVGLHNLVIQRVHYSVKKYMAQTRNLEFRWRQSWDSTGDTDFMTHMMPFYSYDIPHTCGPDPKICCQFDFKRLPGHGVSCPWKEPPKPINKKNVAVRAQLLLDQYRKKAELYRTNVLLVPLGDDFRFEYTAEWDNQFQNYYKIFDYLNHNPSLHVEAKFGTLTDYFKALMEETTAEGFPSLSGDFFTYADRDDHYWSGYFTSRPFHKRLDRVLIGYLRAAEILFALAWGSNRHTSSSTSWLLSPQAGFPRMLRDARRSLSLFQHHDGVTGTARDNVMEDYARKMVDAINQSQHVIQQAAHFLLSPPLEPYLPNPEHVYFDLDDHRRHHNSLPERKLLIFREGESKRLVMYNSLPYSRQEIVSVHVFSPHVQITDGKGEEVDCQTSPVFSQGSVMDESRYEVFFLVDVPALGLASYNVVSRPSQKNVLSKVKVLNSFGPSKLSTGFEDVEMTDGHEFNLENDQLRVVLSENSLLKSVTLKKDGVAQPVHVDFVRYIARHGRETSGAYLFLPEGEADMVRAESPLIRVYEGPLYSRAEVVLTNVKHTVTLYNRGYNTGAIEIVNLVDIVKESNYELAMRISTHIQSADEFYTDLNGMQMTRRKRFAKIPLQGNFYPMPTAAFIEDDNHRLTVISGQPLAVSSLKEGQLEILQDRRLKQDDNRGLGQGVLDNKPTPVVFRVLVERRLHDCTASSGLPVRLSKNGLFSLEAILHPVIRMMWKPETACDLPPNFVPVGTELDRDLELLSARTLDEETNPAAGLVFHRRHLDTCWHNHQTRGAAFNSTGIINIHTFLPYHFGSSFKRSTLSFLDDSESVDRTQPQTLCLMDFLALLLTR